MADRGVKRNFDPWDLSSDSGDTTISNDSTRSMRESAPSPTTESDSEPRFHPTTKNPTTGGAGVSWTAGPSYQATTSNFNPAPNANIGDPSATATILRTSYHTRQAAAIVLRMADERLALMKMVDRPDFPERFERSQRGEVDVESGEEADDEREEDDEDMAEAGEEMDTETLTEEAAEEMDTETLTEEAGQEMGEEMDTET